MDIGSTIFVVVIVILTLMGTIDGAHHISYSVLSLPYQTLGVAALRGGARVSELYI